MDVNQQKWFFNRWQQRCGSDIPYDLPKRNKDGKKKEEERNSSKPLPTKLNFWFLVFFEHCIDEPLCYIINMLRYTNTIASSFNNKTLQGSDKARI